MAGITHAESRYSRARLAKKVEQEDIIKRRLSRIRVGWSKPMPRRDGFGHPQPTPPKAGAKKKGSTAPRTAPGRGGSHTARMSSSTRTSPVRRGGETTRSEGRWEHAEARERYKGMDPCKLALSNLSEAEMGAILALKRPPGLIRKVFTALMLLVSPFETTELDVTWEAVTDWVEQVGGVRAWLHNLWNFHLAVVPISNAIKTLGYMEAERLAPEHLEVFSQPLSKLAEWIRVVCMSAHDRPVTSSTAKGGSSQPPPKSARGRSRDMQESSGSNREGLDGLAPEDLDRDEQAMQDEIMGVGAVTP